MNKNIIEDEKISLSGNDILKLTNNKCNVIIYHDLVNYRTLDQALGKYGAFVVLYETSKNYGHWCCCIKINNKLVEFFDPISNKPDKEFKWVPDMYKQNPYLSHLMKESKYQLSYNHIKFQKNIRGVNTCGRWCALRIILKNYTLDQFKKVVSSPKYDYDYMVTLITNILF